MINLTTFYSLKEVYKIKNGSLINDEFLEAEVGEYLDTNREKYFPIATCPIGSWSNPDMWYDVDDDMKTLSRVFPNSLFILLGNGGEDNKWISYYCNNKVETVFGNMMFPDISDKFLVANKINKTKNEIKKCQID